MNILKEFEKEQIKILSKDKSYPNFSAGDTVKIHLKVKEGEKERIQVFEGVCISFKKAGLNTSFSVRKISYGEGVERVFPIFSPQISKIEVSKFGDVRRSKLYYLRNRSGKSARITEKNKFAQQKENSSQNKQQNPVTSLSKESTKEKTEQTVESKKNEVKKGVNDKTLT